MQIRVRERFGALQAMDEGRVPWKVVNAGQTAEQVEADIWEIVRAAVETCGDQPLKTMWQEGFYDLQNVDEPV